MPGLSATQQLTPVNYVPGDRNPHWSAASRAIDSQEATAWLEHLVQTQVVYGSTDHQQLKTITYGKAADWLTVV